MKKIIASFLLLIMLCGVCSYALAFTTYCDSCHAEQEFYKEYTGEVFYIGEPCNEHPYCTLRHKYRKFDWICSFCGYGGGGYGGNEYVSTTHHLSQKGG